MKYYERWWQENHGTRRDDLTQWLTESDQTSREAVGRVLDGVGIGGATVLECGPGIYIDAQTIWAERPDVQYHAIDVTPAIVEDGRARGYAVEVGSVEAIPYPDRDFDLVYCRHVLEHLPSYRQAITEMRRVAQQKAVAVFWRIDEAATEDVILWNTVTDVPDTFHNTYSRQAITNYLDAIGCGHEWERTAHDWVLVMDAVG